MKIHSSQRRWWCLYLVVLSAALLHPTASRAQSMDGGAGGATPSETDADFDDQQMGALDPAHGHALPRVTMTIYPLDIDEDNFPIETPATRTNLDIVINAGPTLAANAPALAAFNRAAQMWEAKFTDPITVTISADLQNLGSPSVIGSTSLVGLDATYASVRTAWVASADSDDGILSSLPSAANRAFTLPAGFSATANVAAAKANLKAMGGFGNLDGTFGATDATIIFNSIFAFDFDSSNGVGAGLVDFQTVAAHEIGHALGFTSIVDEIDRRINMGQSGSISPFPIDHLRFLDGSANDPANAADFPTKTRELRPNFSAITDFISSVANEAIENLMSTGAFTGDGRQASHWKDDGLTGSRLGIMDPTLPAQQAWTLSDADVRLLDLIGYDIVMASCSGVNNCSGHGTCVGLNICTCNSGWSGPACSVGVDCNGNGIEDTFETNNGIADDCNDNNVPDDCEPDTDNDGIPNGCDACAGGATSGDSDGNGIVTLADYTKLAQCFLGPGQASFATGCECFRIDGDNDVDLRDFAKFQGKW